MLRMVVGKDEEDVGPVGRHGDRGETAEKESDKAIHEGPVERSAAASTCVIRFLTGDFTKSVLSFRGDPCTMLTRFGFRRGEAQPRVQAPRPLAPFTTPNTMMKLQSISIMAAALALTLVPARGELTIPDSTPAGGPFEATWSGSEDKGRIRILTEDGEILTGGSYGYLKNKKVQLTAPTRPGVYGVGFQPDREVISFKKITVTPVEATVEAPTTVEINAAFDVKWTGPAYKTDTVRVAKEDGSKFYGGSYTYPSNAKGPVLQLKAPIEAGNYQVVYLMSDVVLASTPLKVGGTEATVKSAPTVQAGGSLDVQWTGPNNSQDYITLVKAGANQREGQFYVYTGNSTGNVVSLVVPEALGAYEVAYFTGGKILARQPVDVIPVSATLDAPEEIVGTLVFPIEWTGPANRQDRIIMVAADSDPDLPPAAAVYVVPEEPVANLKAPAEPGGYVLHYRTRAGKTLASRAIKVTPPPMDPGTLTVTAAPTRGFGENSAVELILDASGSMLKRQGDKRRIDIAKETILGLIGTVIPAETGFALRVFGHKEADSCRTDLEIPLGPLNPSAASATVAAINAVNLAKTPIAASLSKVASDLPGVTGERVVILVTDGEETCDGDPALAIRMLRSEGSDVRVNIVGYSIDDAALKETFASWAALGGGQYLDAPDAAELALAMRQALEIPFEVFAGDALLASGITGGAPMGLPAGDYQVHYAWDGKAQTKDIKIGSNQEVSVELP